MSPDTIEDVKLEFEAFVSDVVTKSKGDMADVGQDEWDRAVCLYRAYTNDGWPHRHDFDNVLDAYCTEFESQRVEAAARNKDVYGER